MKTVYIIGAGANKEIGLPIGSELIDKIVYLLNYQFHYELIQEGNKEFYKSIVSAGNRIPEEINALRKAAIDIKNSLHLSSSIDTYIDQHRGDQYIETLGKLAITYTIISRESCSSFRNISTGYNSFSELKDTWYCKLFQIITGSCSVEELSNRFGDISFIIFNYDRCIEHFFFNAIKCLYNTTDNETKDILSCLSFYHPYGIVGNLPHFNQTGYPIVEFGIMPRPDDLVKVSKSIQTFTEGTNPDSNSIKNIHEAIRNADKFVFMGFGYHDQNMDLLFSNPNGHVRDKFKMDTKCLCTVHGVSSPNQDIIKEQISKYAYTRSDKVMFSPNDHTCANFIDHFSRHLSFPK